MRVLVTGGAGYLGSILSRKLLTKGYQVRVMDTQWYGDESIKELVKDVLNISFGIDRYDDRNTLASLSRENPYIHSLGLNSSVNEIIDSSHTLETTDIYELYFNLDNKLSDDEFLSFDTLP